MSQVEAALAAEREAHKQTQGALFEESDARAAANTKVRHRFDNSDHDGVHVAAARCLPIASGSRWVG